MNCRIPVDPGTGRIDVKTGVLIPLATPEAGKCPAAVQAVRLDG
jgi:hypothetical protein